MEVTVPGGEPQFGEFSVLIFSVSRNAKIHFAFFWLLLSAAICAPAVVQAQVLGDPVDVSQDFQKMENVYFIGARVASFDPSTGQGTLQWDRYLRSTTLSFNKIDAGFARGRATEFPGTEYDQDPSLPFSVTFVSPRTDCVFPRARCHSVTVIH